MSGGLVFALVVAVMVTALSGGAVAMHQRRQARRRRAALTRAARVLALPGDDFLRAAVNEIAALLEVDLAFAAELTDNGRVQTVAVSRSGTSADNFNYAIADSPTSQLLHEPSYCHATGVRDRYPDDPQLIAVGARAGAGVAVVTPGGTVIGLLACASQTRFADADTVTAILQIFAARAGTVLLGRRVERERHDHEDHLRRVQRVESVGRLAGGIAHDFNNLLMIMTGYAEILRDRDGASKEVLELIATAQRATALTRQLLAYGRRQVFHTERLDLNTVVSQVRTMLGPLISTRIRITTSLDAALSTVDGDRGQLEQVLVNLALNARDAMPEGGTLLLSTSMEQVEVPFHQMPAGQYVCLTVTDTGTGMTPDVQAHIFEPFYTTKGNRGSGLGLSSVYGIVKQTGGFIWCDSAPGDGTTFRIYLRPSPAGVAAGATRAPAGPPAAPAASGDGRTRGRERVLVVDDELALRRWLARVLQARGYDVADVEDAAAALELMRDPARRPHLVITDIVMPGVTGTRLAEEIERQWPTTRILFVSGFAASNGVRTTEVVRRMRVLEKPFTPAYVATVVREVLDLGPDQPHAPSRVA